MTSVNANVTTSPRNIADYEVSLDNAGAGSLVVTAVSQSITTEAALETPQARIKPHGMKGM